MEKWQHATLQAIQSRHGRQLVLQGPIGEAVLDFDDVSVKRVTLALNKLGDDGWQMVALDRGQQDESTQVTTYYLKRQTPERPPVGGWPYRH